jgi:hypothetical protein
MVRGANIHGKIGVIVIYEDLFKAQNITHILYVEKSDKRAL